MLGAGMFRLAVAIAVTAGTGTVNGFIDRKDIPPIMGVAQGAVREIDAGYSG